MHSKERRKYVRLSATEPISIRYRIVDGVKKDDIPGKEKVELPDGTKKEVEVTYCPFCGVRIVEPLY